MGKIVPANQKIGLTLHRKLIPALLSLMAGIFLVFAFEPFDWYLIAFIAPGIFLYCIYNSTPKQSFLYGLLFGIGLFGFGTSWIYISIHQFGNTSWFVAGFVTALFILYLSLFPATQAYVFTKLFRKKNSIIKCLLVFPATYVGWEWLRETLMTGFPWLFLGYTQTDTLLSGYAKILSVYGVSLVVSIISGALCLMIVKSSKTKKISAIIIVLILIIIAIPLDHHSWTTQESSPIKVALVQGNIPPRLKWDAQKVINNVNKYVRASSSYWHSNIILWPEAAIPITANHAEGLIQSLNDKAKRHHSSLIFGIPISNRFNTKYYNGILLVGEGHGTYLKRHLVPYGEYTPVPRIIKPIMKYFNVPFSDLSPGPAKQNLLLTNHLKIAPLICYEVTYPFLVIDWSRGANLLITVNDDAWFGDSYASPQQIQMAQMRSLETERYMLYSSNTGITAIIAPSGKILAQAPIDTLAVLTGTVFAITGNTPIMTTGYYPIMLILILMVLIGAISPTTSKQ